MACPRTLLEKIVQERNWTIEETCVAFEKTAREMGESATLSPRTLHRWMVGDTDRPRAVSVRVAERHWGHCFEVLVGPPDATDAPSRPTIIAADSIATVSERTDRVSSESQPTSLAVDDVAGDTSGDATAQAAAEALEFTRRAEASDLGPRTLEHLERAVAGMASVFASTPPAVMFPLARAYRRQVAGLIEGRQTLRQRRELFR